jgi:Do/DeqQ family serine protease
MTRFGIRPLSFVFLTLVMSGLSAQERQIAPLPSLAELVERTAPAVVNIAVTELLDEAPPLLGGPRLPPRFEEFRDGLPEEREGAGSGVIVDTENGYVLTNHHVIASASAIRVTLVDNRSFTADVIGSDSLSDLAVLRIEADGLTAIPFASTKDLLVGDYVVAIGNPFGIGQTVTSGIVSALGRAGGFTDNSQGFEDFIQTDASINPGNSGGALINLRGELVGINSAIISTGFGGGNVGIGFAIPSEMITSVMGRLLEFGEVRRGLLGVYMRTITPDMAAELDLGASAGTLVAEVTPGSAADAAGLEIYDVIVGIDGESVTVDNALRNMIAMNLPGDSVDLHVIRGGAERTIRVVLGERERNGDAREPAPDPDSEQAPGPFDDMVLLDESEPTEGIRVRSVRPRSMAAALDVQPDDLIVAINRNPVSSAEEARQIARGTWTLVLEIQRGEQRLLKVLR